MVPRWVAALLPWLGLVPLVLIGPVARAMPQADFTVDSTLDAVDADIGDGTCSTGGLLSPCTLRAAVQEASANPDANTISLPAGIYVLTLAGAEDLGTKGDLDITGPVTITGAGPNSTVIDGNGGLTADRVVDVHSGAVTLTGVAIRNGHAGGPGGGIMNRVEAALTLTNVAVHNNVAAIGGSLFGGGIFSEGQLTVASSTVSTNTNSSADAAGGGIVHVGLERALIVSDTTISGNQAPDLGGGIYVGATVVTITNSTLNNNLAAGGAGIFTYDSRLAVANSTISGNSSSQSGGGLYSHTGNTRLSNVTITNNYADSDAAGGGTGGGAAQQGGTVSFQNSIIAGNNQLDPFGGGGVIEVADDCAGTLTSQGHNLVFAPVGTQCTIAGDYDLALPLLGPLAHNGGATRTHALLPGSPAMDAGDPAGCTDGAGALLTHDQRGAPRPAFGATALRCDLGAYERQAQVRLPLVVR